MKQGDIVAIPFPFTDLSSRKVRPAIIISKHNLGDDIILACISRKKHADSIQISNADLSAGSLLETSFIRYNKIATLSKDIVRKRIAKLKKNKIRELCQACKSLF